MTLIKYGFTGTRNGMNENQIKEITKLIQENINNGDTIEIHHGDCIGSDEEFHNICNSLSNKIKIVIHPPINNKLRAYCKSEYIEKEKPYIKRNHDIVDSTEILLSCPYTKEELRSGTWSTIRYAKKLNKKVLIFN